MERGTLKNCQFFEFKKFSLFMLEKLENGQKLISNEFVVSKMAKKGRKLIFSKMQIF